MPSFSIEEAADLLGVRPASLWRRIRAGEFPAARDESGVWRVELDADGLAAAGTTSDAPDAAVSSVARLAQDLEREVALLRQELQAYEREAEQLAQLRATLQRTLASLRDLALAPPSPEDALPSAAVPARPEPASEPPPAPPAASAPAQPAGAEPAQPPEPAPEPRASLPAAPDQPPPAPSALATDSAVPIEGRDASVATDLELHYVEWEGAPDAPVAVLLHGLTGNARNFDALAQQLAPRLHCYALDLRGHGDSAHAPNGDYQLSTHTHDLDAFLQALGLRRVTLIGTAFGADIALAFAGARPDWVERLVLNDSAPELSDGGLDRIRRDLGESPPDFPSLEAAIDWWRAAFPVLADYHEDAIRRFVGYSVRPTATGRVAWKFDPAFRTLDPQQLRDVDLAVSAGRVTAPTLVVRGAESDVVSGFLAKRLVDALAQVPGGARLVSVEGTGHAPALTEPDALDALGEFLSLPLAV